MSAESKFALAVSTFIHLVVIFSFYQTESDVLERWLWIGGTILFYLITLAFFVDPQYDEPFWKWFK